MFKIISAEIKKIVSKPGIYILSVLLALILVLGVFIYKPTVIKSSQFELDGVSFIGKYTYFTENGDIPNNLTSIEKRLNNSIKSIENYSLIVNNETISHKENISILLDKCNELYNAYQDCSSDNSYQEYIDGIRQNLVSSYINLNVAIENAFLLSQEGSYVILSTKSNYKNYKQAYKNVLSWANVNVSKENLTLHFIEFEKKFKEPLYESINNFKYTSLSKSFVNDFTSNSENTKFTLLNNRLDNINAKIAEKYLLAQSDTDYDTKNASDMDKLANEYANTVDTFVNLIKYELIVDAFNTVDSSKEEVKMMYLSDYSNYNSKSLLQRYKYLFENNKSENDFAKPLTIGVTSNYNVNAYDYSYFILKIFSFVIIMYAIMASCHSIAGEIKEGSMRYLAIRPVSRTTLFFGKWLSVIIMSTILMIFSLIISLCVGGAVYGFDSNPILAIFNGNAAFTTQPIGMLAIFMLSMFLELVVYSLIAMFFSTVFKSDLMSMTVLLVIYLLNILMPVFVEGTNTWLAYYPFSHISLYSLFGSAVYGVSQNFFNLLFGAKIYAGTHIALTLSIIALISIVVGFFAVRIFKNKEL